MADPALSSETAGYARAKRAAPTRRDEGETGGFESRPSCPLCRMIDGRSPPLLFSFSLSFFALCSAASLVSPFFAPRLSALSSSRIPPSCHPRREKKTRALFDCVLGSCREHREPRNGNDSCPSPHRDKDAISLLSSSSRPVSILFFSPLPEVASCRI